MDKINRKIGVFDSGLGGISVLRELVGLMPDEEYIYFGDSEFAPYGIKSKQQITERCIDICEYFKKQNVKAIVVACNTATSAAIDVLRKNYTDIHIVGMEPALKVAANEKENQNIVVMATELTLNEVKFKKLMDKYSFNNTIIKLPCPELVEIVEHGLIDDEDLVKNQLNKYFINLDADRIDSVVLGCTHFVFYKKYIEDILPKTVNVIDGNNGTARNLKNILESNNELAKIKEKSEVCDNNNNIGYDNIIFLNSSIDNNKEYIDLSMKLFNR